VHRTAGQIITLEGGFDNVKVYGASNASIPQAYFNMQKKLLNFKMEIPKLRLSSAYKLKGNFYVDQGHSQMMSFSKKREFPQIYFHKECHKVH